MDALELCVSVAALVALTVSLLDISRAWRRVPDLADVPADGPPPGGAWPPVAVVVAARDEARGIEAAMRSLLEIDYPALELVAVDDRSTDGTGEILDRLAAEDPRLRVVHVRDLPDGWLGKNHALHLGQEATSADLVLFTDADVVFSPAALRRAVRLLLDRGADHLAVVPDMRVPTFAGRAFLTAFAVCFTVYTRPWKVSDPRSRAHVGIGAFNLVRRTSLRAIDGFGRLPLRPDDDLKLAKTLKRAGARALVATGQDDVGVEWYASYGEALRGLEKNMFAGVGYSVAAVAGISAGMIVAWLWPFAGVVVARGTAQLLCAVAVAEILLIVVAAVRRTTTGLLAVLLVPLGFVLFLYAFWRSTALALARGAIQWRGTRYPLALLRTNRV